MPSPELSIFHKHIIHSSKLSDLVSGKIDIVKFVRHQSVVSEDRTIDEGITGIMDIHFGHIIAFCRSDALDNNAFIYCDSRIDTIHSDIEDSSIVVSLYSQESAIALEFEVGKVHVMVEGLLVPDELF